MPTEILKKLRPSNLELVKVIDAPKTGENNVGGVVPHTALPGIEVPIGYLKGLAAKLSLGGGQDTFGSQLMVNNGKLPGRDITSLPTKNYPAPTYTAKKSGQVKDDGGTGPGDEA